MPNSLRNLLWIMLWREHISASLATNPTNNGMNTTLFAYLPALSFGFSPSNSRPSSSFSYLVGPWPSLKDTLGSVFCFIKHLLLTKQFLFL